MREACERQSSGMMADCASIDEATTRRVMSIDGGGLKGAMQAAFLAQIEDTTGERVVDHFDLIVGTSTGGIIALGIGLGLPCRQILDFYLEKGPAVFGQSGGRLRSAALSGWRRVKRVVANKHPAEPLRRELAEVFGDRRLGESQTRLVIPAWDSVQRRPYLFKTAHLPRFEMDYRVPVVEVAMATAAAPTYLPAHRLGGGLELVDGGVWANNPATVAAVEATAVLEWSPETVFLLGLGCTDERLIVPKRMGLVTGARLGVEMMFQGQSFASDAAARVLLGGGGGKRDPVLRVNATVDRNYARLDGAKRLAQLAELGRDQARQALPRMRRDFLTNQRTAFTPCHGAEAQNR